MPASITKNQQPEEILRRMFQRAGLSEIVSFRELTEGFFNVAYEARDAAGGEYILKIAPPSGSVLMTHEKNIMWSEVHSMKRVREELSVPAAKILYYDPGCTVCDSEYFIMEKLPGSSFSSRMEEDVYKRQDYKHVALLLSPQSMSVERFFDRPDPEKQFLLGEIQKCPDPEKTLENFLGGIARVNSRKYYDQFMESGFFTIVREDEEKDTREEILEVLARHFGLEEMDPK